MLLHCQYHNTSPLFVIFTTGEDFLNPMCPFGSVNDDYLVISASAAAEGNATAVEANATEAAP